jgi:hypothetical protein
MSHVLVGLPDNIHGFETSKSNDERSVAQAVNYRIPTARTWVQVRVNTCKICGG